MDPRFRGDDSIKLVPTRSTPAYDLEHRIGGALARFPSTGHRAPERLMRGFARQEDAIAQRLGQHFARGLSARRSGRGGAKHPRLVVPARGVATLDEVLHVGAVEPAEP